MNNYKRYLIKRIVLLNTGTLVVIIITYLIMVFSLSHINSFWEIFKGKDSYVEKDTIPPVAPYLDLIPDATKEEKITITGKAEVGNKVILYVDESKFGEQVTDNEGNFAFADIPVSYSLTNIKAVSVDSAGNESTESKEYSILRDTQEPEIEIITPKKGEVYKATERTYSVSGKTEPGAMVTVNEVLAFSDTEGNFTAQIALSDGGNEIKIKAVDKAGNEKEEKAYVTYEKIK